MLLAGLTAGVRQKLHRFADDFGGVALDAVLVGVATGTQAAFNVNRAAFVQVLLSNLCLTAEEDDAVPFGFFLQFALAVFVAARGGDDDVADRRAAVGGVAGFRFSAEVADQNDFVDRSHD